MTYKYCENHIGMAPSTLHVVAKGKSSGPEFPDEAFRFVPYLLVGLVVLVVLQGWYRGFAHVREGRKIPPGKVEDESASVEKGYLTCVLTGFGSLLVHPVIWLVLTNWVQRAFVPTE